jgi:RimJ/RimL family protein N-acetyltransferase
MGVRTYEKAGFKEFGRHRQRHRSGGPLHDEIFMQCLSDEF